MQWWTTMRDKYTDLVTEYGGVAIGTYLVLFFMVLGGFWVAISLGFRVEGAAQQTGTFWAAYLATKLTQPLRIGATVVLTPFVASAKRRLSPAS